MRIDCSRSGFPGNEAGNRLRDAGVEPGGRHPKTLDLAVAARIHGEGSAAGDRLPGEDEQVEQELDAVLRRERPRQIPRDPGLVVLERAAGDGFGIAETCTP